MQTPPVAITHMMMLAGITPRPIDSKPETRPGQAQSGEQKSAEVERERDFLADVGDVPGDQHEAERADRDVDEENPTP